MKGIIAEPPVLVARAETESVAGLKALAKAVNGHYREQRQAMDRSDAHGLEIGRLICEFAARPEVAAHLAVKNAKENRPGGGRPQAAHCFVAEMIATEGLCTQCTETPLGSRGIGAGYLGRCARAFIRAQKKGLPLNTPIRVAEASALLTKITDRDCYECQPSPERLFDSASSEGEDGDGEEGGDGERALTPEKRGLAYAASIIRRAKLHISVNPGMVRGLVRGLSPILEQHGFAVMPLKKGEKGGAFK